MSFELPVCPSRTLARAATTTDGEAPFESDGQRIWLPYPRIDEVSVDEKPEAARGKESNGSEMILLVEDQEAVRQLMKRILEVHGYQILEAGNSAEALDIARKYSGEIHLLLTDVVLPGINGKELSERLKALRPKLKVLFTSGYTADIIAHRGVPESGVPYISKPFTSDALAVRVREVLTEPSTTQ
jgi:two-component system cell cycle sensor histidine kinase/response regulator CckA